MPPKRDQHSHYYIERIPARVASVYEVSALSTLTGEVLCRGKWRAFTMAQAEEKAQRFFENEWRLSDFAVVGRVHH